MKNTVIHHSADFDGLFCREIARKFLPADTTFIGWDYGYTAVPIPPEGAIYVMDLSPAAVFGGAFHASGQAGVYLGGKSFTDRLVWIDHHKSAIETHPAWLPGYRIDGVAACRLAWVWFNEWSRRRDLGMEMPTREQFVNREVIEPLAVRLAGEYDIWDKRDPDAETFQYGLRSRELTADHWAALLHPSMMDFATVLLGQGKPLQRYQQANDEAVIQDLGFDLEFEGLTFLACNAARYNSQLFTAGLGMRHDACLGFKWTGRDWSVSLYHAPGKEHHDLSKIAAKHGGGGHRGACGFRAEAWPWLPRVKEELAGLKESIRYKLEVSGCDACTDFLKTLLDPDPNKL